MITLEDVLELIIGDIQDEGDAELPEIEDELELLEPAEIWRRQDAVRELAEDARARAAAAGSRCGRPRANGGRARP